MRKISASMFVLFVSLLILAACSGDETVSGEKHDDTKFRIRDQPQSKTYFPGEPPTALSVYVLPLTDDEGTPIEYHYAWYKSATDDGESDEIIGTDRDYIPDTTYTGDGTEVVSMYYWVVVSEPKVESADGLEDGLPSVLISERALIVLDPRPMDED